MGLRSFSSLLLLLLHKVLSLQQREKSEICVHSSEATYELPHAHTFKRASTRRGASVKMGYADSTVQTHPHPHWPHSRFHTVTVKSLQRRHALMCQWNSRSHPESPRLLHLPWTRLHEQPREQTPSFVLKCLCRGSVSSQPENLYAEMTLVLQILYCLGSPAHGPPTGFLGHRNRTFIGQRQTRQVRASSISWRGGVACCDVLRNNKIYEHGLKLTIYLGPSTWNMTLSVFSLFFHLIFTWWCRCASSLRHRSRSYVSRQTSRSTPPTRSWSAAAAWHASDAPTRTRPKDPTWKSKTERQTTEMFNTNIRQSIRYLSLNYRYQFFIDELFL